jgi:endonuclease/exonuclease/phosphatase family metal-dependent hydrolase
LTRPRRATSALAVAAALLAAVGCAAGDDPAASGSDDAAGTEEDTNGDGDGGTDDLRVATWNVENLGLADAQDLAYARDVATRLDADVLCLQEVLDEEASTFAGFLTELYPYRLQGEVGDALGGPQTVACLSKREPLGAASISARETSSDPDAADIGREFVWLRIPFAGGSGLSLVSVHLKAGQDGVDQFRRAVEGIRLRRWVDALRTMYPGEPIVLLGDFNVRPDDEALGMSFADLPPGLPSSYELGDDVMLPVVYDPLADLEGAGFAFVDATLASSGETSTHRPTLWRLDYVLVSSSPGQGLNVAGSLVFDACRDTIEAPIPLSGAPVPCAATETASDHWPVVVDLAR